MKEQPHEISEAALGQDTGTEQTTRLQRLGQIREEVKRKYGVRGLNFEQQQEVNQLVEQAELMSGGAAMEFDEKGNVQVKPTAEQIMHIKQDWERYVSSLEERFHNMDTVKLEKYIQDLERPNRHRPGVFQGMYEGEPGKTLEFEQRERAALKEVLARRQLAKE